MTDKREGAPLGEAEWFEWREEHRNYPPYEIWMAAFAAGKTARSEPADRSAVLHGVREFLHAQYLTSKPAADVLDALEEYLKNAAPQDTAHPKLGGEEAIADVPVQACTGDATRSGIPAAAAPSDLVQVPREPTDEMMIAGAEACITHEKLLEWDGERRSYRIYRAMLAAAPAQKGAGRG